MVDRPHVLLVDDDADYATLVLMWLRTLGCEGSWAQDPRRGPERPLDLVILDCNLPRCSFEEAVQVLRRRYPGSPILCVSSAGAGESPVPAIARHAKPLALGELETIIRPHLSLPS